MEDRMCFFVIHVLYPPLSSTNTLNTLRLYNKQCIKTTYSFQHKAIRLVNQDERFVIHMHTVNAMGTYSIGKT